MKARFIIKLEGGLGNQLFQYAHAISLQKEYGGVVLIDQHAFTRRQNRICALDNYVLNEHTEVQLSIFDRVCILLFVVLCRLTSKLRWINSYTSYQRFVKIGLYYQFQIRYFNSLVSPCKRYNYVTGNWISPKFFISAQKEVRNAITYKGIMSSESSKILCHIKSSESVCIHIRLGDYLSAKWKDKLFVCSPEYYKKSIKYIKSVISNPVFFVFTNRHNDFEMIQQEYNLGNVIYVDLGNSDVEDMELMRNCKHFIMSNSTYSWWAQFLSENNNKIVVAPSRFNNYPEWDMHDIYINSWHLIEV